jgi:hypothetical protein
MNDVLKVPWIILAPGPIVPREAKRDTILNISDTNEPRMLIVKKGTQVSRPWSDCDHPLHWC